MTDYEKSESRDISRAFDYGGMPQGRYAFSKERDAAYKALFSMIAENLDPQDPKSMRTLYSMRSYLDGAMDAIEAIYGRDGKYQGQPMDYEGEALPYGPKERQGGHCKTCSCSGDDTILGMGNLYSRKHDGIEHLLGKQSKQPSAARPSRSTGRFEHGN
jgi:hypothetical protein